MSTNKYRLRIYKAITAVLLLSTAFGLFGCSRFQRGIRVIPLPNQDVLELSGANIVELMRGTGFSDDQIAQYGADVQGGLARSGRVQIDVNGRAEVIFAVQSRDVYIGTKLRGIFVYNVDTGWSRGGGRIQ
ncbi:MAG: hypothetical protein JW715_01420 [Sedimentisphaerales bacterium]|nr:hypothetical protein [Sedimentisphaerales bacterium]